MTKHNSAVPFTQDLGNFIEGFFNGSIGSSIGRDFANGVPSANVIETKTLFRIDLAVPGLEKSDFTIHLENGNLGISAKKENAATSDEEKFKRKEFNFNNFHRSFKLPKGIDLTAIQATYENGILAISLPKIVVEEGKDNHTIEIK